MSPDAIRLHAEYLAAREKAHYAALALKESEMAVRIASKLFHEADDKVDSLRVALELALGFGPGPND